MSSQLTPADQSAYQQLISWCADECPHTVCSKPKVEHLPQLKAEDVALICRKRDLDVQDHFVELINYSALAQDLLQKDICALGARVAGLLERACRASIAYDVMVELEARETAENIEYDTERYLRGLPVQSV